MTIYTRSDIQPLTMDDLVRTVTDFRAKHGVPIKAVRVSGETLRWLETLFPVYPSQDRANTLYGIPIQVDNDLALFECKPVYD